MGAYVFGMIKLRCKDKKVRSVSQLSVVESTTSYATHKHPFTQYEWDLEGKWSRIKEHNANKVTHFLNMFGLICRLQKKTQK